jgi:aspartyl-tRNA(Asn)/glutamyl-tRNA(Gln) amidotransferase subunit C
MSISEEEVRHVALLARLGLTDDEVLRLRDELSNILEQVDKIGELDLEGVEPMAHAVDLTNVTRPDENRPSLTQEEALLNAPESRDGAFVIPRIV